MDSIITTKKLFSLFVFPFFAMIMIYTNSYHNLFAKTLTISNFDGISVVISEHNIFFYIHTAYSYFILLISLFVLIMNWFNVARLYRKQMLIIITSMLIPIIINVLHIYLNRYITSLDLTPLSFGFTLIFFIIGTRHLNFTYINPIARVSIFKTNITPIIVLDENNKIIDMNLSAEKVFYNNFTYYCGKDISILDNLIQKTIFTDTTTKIYLDSKKYNVKTSIIYDNNNNNNVLGSFKAYYDITTEENYLNELKYLGSHDALTGLYNRSNFNSIVSTIIKDENLPLGIILGDLNYLKIANDTLGHKVGDEIIKASAKKILRNVSPCDFVFRLGGDEFSILLPNTNDVRIKEIINNINAAFEADDNYNISISLGYSIMKKPNQSFNRLFSKADANMYLEKARIKMQ